MKLLFGLIGAALGNDIYKRCTELSDRIVPGPIKDGNVECKGLYCTLKCVKGFSNYGGFNRAKCVKHKKTGKIFWNRGKLGECRTCPPLEVNTDEMKINCTTTKKGLKVCLTSCKNGQGVKPLNNDKVAAVCKCMHPTTSTLEEDGQCHWRIGRKIIDRKELGEEYYKNWYCSKREPSEQKEPNISKLKPPSYRIPPGLVCNVKDHSTDRIVGGVSAIPHSWPWMVNLSFGSFLCGGTILDDETVITAAHCCDGYMKRARYVKGIIGDHSYNLIDVGEKTFTAISVHLHPEYSRRTIANDICIIKFPNMAISTRPTVARACLPASDWHPAENTRCWAAGWGVTSSGRAATDLQEVDLKIISDETCQTTANAGYLVKGSMFCAGWLKGGKDGCQGDSGGPLICTDDTGKIPILTGVTSWGFGCGTENSPGVWTKVSTYTDWIGSLTMNI